MASLSSEAPVDLIKSLVQNLEDGKPLLSDVSLYRGTALPDQTQGSFSNDTMHGSMLLQVAASYTHSWKDEGYIGAYPIDRENTRFFSDFSLEKHLTGEPVKSYSVKEAEKMLEPLVREVAVAKTSSDRARAEEKLENTIKKDLYEAAVPIRTASGEANRPKDLYIYTGPPNLSIRQAIPMQMTKVTAQNESVAKNAIYKGLRNKPIQTLHQLGQQGGRVGVALGKLQQFAQKDFGDQLKDNHGHKPLDQFLDAAAKEPVSDKQARIEKFASSMSEGIKHPSPEISGKAIAVSEAMSKLDPTTATYTDLVKASSNAVKSFEAKSAGSELSKTAAPAFKPNEEKQSQAKAPNLER